MNISQHSIMPIGYPVLTGYYNDSGTLINNASYVSFKFLTFGCNRFFKASLIGSSGSAIRTWRVGQSERINFVPLTVKSLYSIDGSSEVAGLTIYRDSSFGDYVNIPFLIFFKDDSTVASLSLINSFSPDVIGDRIV